MFFSFSLISFEQTKLEKSIYCDTTPQKSCHFSFFMPLNISLSKNEKKKKNSLSLNRTWSRCKQKYIFKQKI